MKPAWHPGKALVQSVFLGLTALALGGCASLAEMFPGATAARAAPQATQVAEYQLEVQAPPALRTLLLAHLDLARYAPADQQVSAQELGRLAAAAPQQARELLETEGYFNPQVTVNLGRELPAKVTLSLIPGPQAKVSSHSLNFAGAIESPQTSSGLRQRLLNQWPMQPGHLFTQKAWAEAKTGLLNQARAQGYPLAHWAATAAQVRTESNSVELTLLLDSGPLVRLGELQIEGLVQQPRSSVERLTGFETGAPYTEKALLDFQERLIKTTLFDRVSVDIQPQAATAEATPVSVRLHEAPLQQATLSLGYQSSTGPRIGGDYLNRHPFGLDMRSRFKLNLGQDKKTADLELSSHPQADMQRNLASVAVEQLTIAEKVTLNLRARLGRIRETDSQDHLYYLETLRARETDPQGQVTAGAISANSQWTRRRLDSLLLPTEGYAASLLVGLGRADNSVASSGLFGQAHAKLYAYKAFAGGWWGSARTEWAQVFAADPIGLPEALRFRAGGDESVRGHGQGDLGPTDADGNPTGGRVLWTGSVELAHALTADMPNLLGAAFFDAGQAASGWRGFKPVHAYGLGLRYRSPLGTMKLDLARAPELQRWRIHFTLGVAM